MTRTKFCDALPSIVEPLGVHLSKAKKNPQLQSNEYLRPSPSL